MRAFSKPRVGVILIAAGVVVSACVVWPLIGPVFFGWWFGSQPSEFHREFAVACHGVLSSVHFGTNRQVVLEAESYRTISDLAKRIPVHVEAWRDFPAPREACLYVSFCSLGKGGILTQWVTDDYTTGDWSLNLRLLDNPGVVLFQTNMSAGRHSLRP